LDPHGFLDGYRIANKTGAPTKNVLNHTSITKMEHGGGRRPIKAATKYLGHMFPIEMEYIVILSQENQAEV
jgi:hypothetical protein